MTSIDCQVYLNRERHTAYLWPPVDMENRLALSSYLNVNLCNLAGEISANLKSCDRTKKVPSLQSYISPGDNSSTW
jgi:hypothetical protein